MLFILKVLGIKNLFIYIFIASLAATPVASMLANPSEYAWQPTEEDFNHGTYWAIMWLYMLFSSVTGLSFWFGMQNKSNNP